jgi:hypothetical protein
MWMATAPFGIHAGGHVCRELLFLKKINKDTNTTPEFSLQAFTFVAASSKTLQKFFLLRGKLFTVMPG